MRYLMLCCGLALFLFISVSIIALPAQADATITVTTTTDVIGNDMLCSLREAIIAANTDSAFGDCPAGSGADTIALSPALPQPATFILTNTGANEDGALTGDLDIVGTLTISGTGTTVIDGDAADRVLQILPAARVTVLGVTIRNGNPGAADGGGIAVDLTGRLTLQDTTVISNMAANGGGIEVRGLLTMNDSTVTGNHGGGISNDGGQLTLTNVQIINNRGGYGIHNQNQAPLTFNSGLVSGNQGGGIYNRTSPATLSDLTITNNTNGGGVRNLGATLSHLTMYRCVVADNTVTSNGGGIFNEGVGAIADLHDARIQGNTAAAAGGGLFNNGIMTLNGSVIDHNQARSGGGIDHFGGNLHLTNDTLSANVASDNGGGLYNRSSAIVTNVSFAGNISGGPDTGGNIFNDTAQLSLVNTIVAYSDTDGNCFNSEGLFNSLGHNLDDGDTCGFHATGDIINTDPRLGPLQDNGGHTLTRALLPGSPAIDAGDDASCPETDQRGLPRPQGAACDIGAYESGAATADLAIRKARLGSGSVVAGGRITYTLTITNAGPTTPVSATVVDTWTPSYAVVGVDAPGCAVDLGAGVVTCTQANLGVGSALLPAPYLVFTTSAAYSGLLTNTASVSPLGGISDLNPADNMSGPVVVTVTKSGGFSLYLPLILR